MICNIMFDAKLKVPDVSITCRLVTGFDARGGVVVKALRHKPAGREFDSRWFH
jgi:hypothetical protein